MRRKESETVPEGNGLIPQDAGKMITWEGLRRVVKETWGRRFKINQGGFEKYGIACSKART